MDSEKRGYMNVKKVPFQRIPRQVRRETGLHTFQRSATALLPYLLIPVEANQVKKVCLNDI